MATLQEQLEAAVAQTAADSLKLKAIVNGPAAGAGSLVATDGGDVKTLARALAEVGDTSNQALKDLTNVATADFLAKAQAAGITDPYAAVDDLAADFAVLDGDEGKLLRVDAGAAPVTATLPLIASLANGEGWPVVIMKKDATANGVTALASGADTINGAASLTMTNQFENWTFVADTATNTWSAVGGIGFDPTVAHLNAPQTFTAAQRGTIAPLFSVAGAIAITLADANSFTHTLTENTVVADPADIATAVGQQGTLHFTQPAAGNGPFTVGFGPAWVVAGAFNEANDAKDSVAYEVVGPAEIRAVIVNVG